jgi:surface polysaccharide O-acyltransferase-like enzyme
MVGFSIIGALLCFGIKHWDRTSAFSAKLSRNTFAVYIFHPLALSSLSLLVRNWQVDPAVKHLLVGPLAVAFSFLLAFSSLKSLALEQLYNKRYTKII